MGKSIDIAKALLENMASYNYHWSSERPTTKRSGAKYEVDVLTLLVCWVDMLAQRLDKVGTSLILGSSSGILVRVYAIFETCGVQEHVSVEQYNGPPTIKHDNALHNFNIPEHNNPYSNSYNSGWKSHPNPFHKNSNSEPQSSIQSPGIQCRILYTPSPQLPRPKFNLESLMEHFIHT